MRKPIFILVFAMAAGTVFAQATPPEKPKTATDRLSEAHKLYTQGQNDPAIVLFKTVVADATATPAQKRQSLSSMIDIYRRVTKNQAAAIATADEMSRVLAADPEMVYEAYNLQADMHWEVNQKNEAIAKLRQYVQANAAQRKLCSQVEMKIVGWLWTLQNWKEAYAEAAKAVEFDTSDDKLVSTAFYQMGEAAWQFQDFEKALAAYRRVMEPKYAAHRNIWEVLNANNKIVDVLTKLKRTDELIAHLSTVVKQPGDWGLKQEYAMRLAYLLGEQKRVPESMAAFENVFVDACGIPDRWFEAQQRLVDMLRAQNRFPEALQAARICFDACSDGPSIHVWTGVIMELFREIDKDVTRANQFLNFQIYGPAGKDGVPGTADDLSNPLAAVGYASYPAREQAFAKARKEAGDSYRASRLRAMSYVFTGHPVEATKYYADAMRRCTAADMRMAANELVAIGLRGVQGHTAGMDKAFLFVAQGPAGTDGKPGTADDLVDPFTPLGITAPAIGTSGLAEIPPDQIKLLKDLQPILEDTGQYWRQQGPKREALLSLARLHVALADWGAPGQKQWYIRQMLLSDPGMQLVLADAALASANASQLHLAGMRQFAAELEAAGIAAGIKQTPAAIRCREQVKVLVDFLEKPHDLKPKHQAFPVPPKK